MKFPEELSYLYNWLMQTKDQHGGVYTLTLFALVRGLQPSLCYEIGVSSVGQSTEAILTALRGHGGRLISCDRADCDGAISDPLLREHWTFRRMDSLDFIASLSIPADFIYIDGNHDLERVLAEVEAFWPLLKEGGLMVLHDTISFPDGPGRVLQMVVAQGIEAISLPWAHGIGVILKRWGAPAQLILAVDSIKAGR